MKRSKSNLIQAIQKRPEPVILGAGERAKMLAMVHCWRLFEMYLSALVAWGECQRLWLEYQADQSYEKMCRWLKHRAWAGIT